MKVSACVVVELQQYLCWPEAAKKKILITERKAAYAEKICTELLPKALPANRMFYDVDLLHCSLISDLSKTNLFTPLARDSYKDVNLYGYPL